MNQTFTRPKSFLLASILAVSTAISSCASISSIDDVNIEARYQVNPDLSLTLKSGDPDDVDITAWQKVVHLLPGDIL